MNQPFDKLRPPVKGSIAIWTRNVAARLGKRHEVTVYGRRNRLQRHVESAGDEAYVLLRTFPYRYVRRIWRWMPADEVFGLPTFASLATYLDFAIAVALSIRRRRIDVAHVHNFSQFVPVLRAINPRLRIVLHMNCEWLTQLPRDVVARRIAKCDLVLGSSDYITQLIRREFPEFADRCLTIYNGVDTDVFVPATPEHKAVQNGSARVLFVGRVSPEKGIHDLLDAFVAAARRNEHLSLDILGPIGSLPIEYIVQASDDPKIRALARHYERDYFEGLRTQVPEDLQGRIRFLGPTAHEHVLEHYHGAAVVVNPSYSESFGMSLAEAMACGVPVVATRVGGMVEIVGDGAAGVLVERADVPAITEAILALARDPARRKSMGDAGRERAVSLYSWDAISRKLAAYYEAL